MDEIKFTSELPCMACDEKAIQLISRANWKCLKCGKDNSLWVVLAYKVANEESDSKEESVGRE